MNSKYIPNTLSKQDKKKQKQSIQDKTIRPKLKSYTSKESKWTKKANKYFKGNTSLNNISKIIGVSVYGLNKILDKGKGAYFSSGSRPNQTPESWARARLYSVLFGGKARNIDKNIVEKFNIPKLSI